MNGTDTGLTAQGAANHSLLRLPQWQLLVGWTLGLAALFVFIGRTDSAQEPLFGALLFWLLHVGIGLAFCCAATHWLNASRWLTGRPWLLIGLAGLLAAVCFAPVALALEASFARFGIGLDDLDAVDSAALPQALLSELESLAPSFCVSWLLLMSVYRQVNSERRPPGSQADPSPQGAQTSADAPAPMGAEVAVETVANPAKPMSVADPHQGRGETSMPSGLAALIPPALGSELWHIAADLNYLHVRTSKGQAMVLYALARAADELGRSGLLVHRSHWVAISAVRRVHRRRQGLIIELLDGSEVPVARRRQAQVRSLFGDRFVRRIADSG